MKKIIIVCIITIFLIGLGTFEVIMVKKINNTLLNNVNTLHTLTIENQNDLTTLLYKVDHIKADWDNVEPLLCLMFNHKDLSTITDTLSKYRAYVYNNDYDNAIAEISLLKEYAEKNDHVMGFNFQNLCVILKILLQKRSYDYESY